MTRLNRFLSPERCRWTAATAASCALVFIVMVGVGATVAHAAPPPSAQGAELADWLGTVTYVVDGDTLHVRPAEGGKPVSVRIDGIDAPEICQQGGGQSRSALGRLVLGQQVTVHPKAHDRYSRLVAAIFKGGVDQGAQMVATGQAWAFRFEAGRGPYAALQRNAAVTRLGVFSSGQRPQTPALFRKMNGSCY